MSQPKSQFLSAFGVSFSIFKAIVDAVLEKGGNDDDLRSLLTWNGKAKLERIAAIIVEKPVPAVPEPTVVVIDIKVDGGMSVAQLIVAGKYGKNSVDDNITEANFPLWPIPVNKELVRICFNRDLPNREAVIAARAALKLEPVTSIAYILTVGADKPNLQHEAPISDIDSVWVDTDSRVRCPCLWSLDGVRSLYVHRRDLYFSAGEWVLALRNKQP